MKKTRTQEHTFCFHLYENLEKTNLLSSKSNQWLGKVGAGEAYDSKRAQVNFCSYENVLYLDYDGGYMVVYTFFKTHQTLHLR